MKISVLSCVLVLSFVIVGGANASVLTFDDITTGDDTSFTYGGLSWSDFSTIHKDTPIFGITNSGYHNGVVSGNYVATSVFEGTPDVASNSGLFDFNGAYLTAAWNNGLNIEVVGNLDGVEKYNHTVTVDTDSPTWFDFNFFGIDELVFLPSDGVPAFSGHPGGHTFAMDDFTFNTASIPIPSAIWLLGTGLIGIVGLRKFNRRKQS